MAHDVFISYSSKDKSIADAVCFTLEGRYVRCWIAPRDVMPGQAYAESLIDGLNQSRLMVLVFSANSNNSPQVIREVERAVNKGIPILPFRIENVTPSKSMEYFVSSSHWLDAMTPPLEKHLQKLGDTVQLLLTGQAQQPQDTLPAQAPAKKRGILVPVLVTLGCIVVAAGILGALFFSGVFRHQGTLPKAPLTAQAPQAPETPPTASTVTPGKTLPAGVLYMDDFSNMGSGWPRFSNDTQFSNYDNGEFSLQGKKPNINAISANQSAGHFSDMVLETEARLAGGPDASLYGVVFRMKDINNYYCFMLSGDNAYFIEKRVDGVFSPLVKRTPSPAIKKAGATNLIKVVCKGPDIVFYVNGSHVAGLSDPTFSEGWIGFAVRPYEAPASARFNSIKVSSVQ